MTQGRAARAASRVGFSSDDVLYSAMPLFHGNALSAAVLPALASGATLALRRKFSASNFLPDVRECRATFFNSVGRAIAHIVATPPTEHDRDHRLRYVLGPETSAQDKAAFTERFGVPLIEGYGSSENAIVLKPVARPRPGALGRASARDDVAVVDPVTGEELPVAVFDGHGRLTNAEACIGELVGRQARSNFEGYYNNPEADAERTRNGWYWSGDLAYRDEDGIFYFAGRTGDWLRVDSENFAAAPVERILARFEGVSGVAVYPVPDTSTGDQVMAALELEPGVDVRPRGLHRVPGRPGGPGHQVGTALRAGGGGPAGDRHRQDGQEAAAGAAVGDRRPGLAPGRPERPLRAADPGRRRARWSRRSPPTAGAPSSDGEGAGRLAGPGGSAPATLQIHVILCKLLGGKRAHAIGGEHMDLGLSNAVVVVAGGTTGMGRAAADCFATDGARVAVLARTQTGFRRNRRRPAGAGLAGRRRPPDRPPRPDSVEEAIAQVGERWGHCNALVNAAGPFPGGIKGFEEYTDAEWLDVVNGITLSSVRTIRRPFRSSDGPSGPASSTSRPCRRNGSRHRWSPTPPPKMHSPA